MVLEGDLRDWILSDYQLCEANIKRITSGSASNCRVINSSEYLRPETVKELLQIDNPNGLAAYYSRIKSNLEIALEQGKFPQEFKNFEPPVTYWHLIN